MSAYNYYPAYNPYAYYPQQYQPVQPTVQQLTQQQTQQPQQTNKIWVKDITEAQMYPVGPNNAVSLWDINGKVVYDKIADASGRPSMRIFDLVERTEKPSEKEGDSSDGFATKAELSAVVGVIKGFNGVIDSIRGDIDTLKGDVYGLAGKKKPVRKQEDGENE